MHVIRAGAQNLTTPRYSSTPPSSKDSRISHFHRLPTMPQTTSILSTTAFKALDSPTLPFPTFQPAWPPCWSSEAPGPTTRQGPDPCLDLPRCFHCSFPHFLQVHLPSSDAMLPHQPVQANTPFPRPISVFPTAPSTYLASLTIIY